MQKRLFVRYLYRQLKRKDWMLTQVRTRAKSIQELVSVDNNSTGKEPGMHSSRFLIYIVAAFLAAETPTAPQWQQLPKTPALPTPEHSGYAPVNGVRIWYATFGRGEPVILLHGGLANSNYWGYQVPALAKHYRVIVMDSRGHGRSTRNEDPLSYHLMARDVIGLMNFLHIPKVTIVGWSDGAIVGLDMAINYPARLSRLFAFAANS